jgi:hypothetical protein
MGFKEIGETAHSILECIDSAKDEVVLEEVKELFDDLKYKAKWRGDEENISV